MSINPGDSLAAICLEMTRHRLYVARNEHAARHSGDPQHLRIWGRIRKNRVGQLEVNGRLQTPQTTSNVRI
jgi:hypothetical protein